MTGSPFGALPHHHYGTILADPPWAFATWSKKDQTRATENHYPVMSTEDIYSLPVSDLAAPDCILFLWAIKPMLPQALITIERWGFTYKTVAFTWAKRTRKSGAWHMGLGYWTRANGEFCLLATRGKPTRVSKSVRELIDAPLGRHSEKPTETHERIEALVKGPYVELFARQRRPNWAAWGNEIKQEDA